MKGRVLVVEDDLGLLELLQDELEDDGHTVLTATTLERGRELMAEAQPELVITDLRLPDGRGDTLLPGSDGAADAPAAQGDPAPGAAARRMAPDRPAMLVITAFGDVRDAVSALQAGADDFLTKPLDLEHLRLSVQRLLEMRSLRGELDRFRRLLPEESFHGMVGASAPMRRLMEQIRIIAQGDGPALIVGESGTGKEQVARALHAESPRSRGPFVAVNCAGVPAELLESEFFGHAAGAFTGARTAHEGLFAQADGGTLLLDEIGEMPMTLQAKLLRVLEEQRIRPVGGSEERDVDVRVVAATNRDVGAHMEEGLLREDLYFRLETFTIDVPALRERGDDLELLARHFLGEFAARHDRSLEGFEDDALAALRAHDFPGNVRELRNAVERAVLFAAGPRIARGDLPARLRAGSGVADDDADSWFRELPTVEALQRRYARWLLAYCEGNKKRTAEILGVTRGTLYRWLEQD